MSAHNWIIDAGHGGEKNGWYTTAPAKMVIYPDGYTIKEGIVNRLIAKHLIDLLLNSSINHKTVYDAVEDTPLQKRCDLANTIYHYSSNSILVSIHCNASPLGIRKPGTGFEIFTTPGKTKSDPVAEIFAQQYMEDMPEFKFRSDLSDGDHDKEVRLYILRKTVMPSILVENLFMDNRREAEFLNSEAGQKRIASTLFNAIIKTEKIIL